MRQESTTRGLALPHLKKRRRHTILCLDITTATTRNSTFCQTGVLSFLMRRYLAVSGDVADHGSRLRIVTRHHLKAHIGMSHGGTGPTPTKEWRMPITVTEWNRLITVRMTAASLLKRLDIRDESPEMANLRIALADAEGLEALTGPQWRALARPFMIG